MKSDIKIARGAVMQSIKEMAAAYGVGGDDLEFYGRYKAKLTDELWEQIKGRLDGKLVLVTAINPTPAGEEKTITTVGLGEAFGKIGKKAITALRELSLSPCFRVGGGATGGGYAQVVPVGDLSLHFTGDFHATTSANSLLAALLNNHIQQGNALGIDPRQTQWKHCVDMNDRVLRNIVVSLGAEGDGMVREDHFVITVTSEIMVILRLADNMGDSKNHLGKITVVYSFAEEPITIEQLHVVRTAAAPLREALKSSLIQTLEHVGALTHDGPLASIAHGCDSVRATKTTLKLADVVVTKAGFGAGLGVEEFLDIKCRKAGLKPDAVVLVTTVGALEYNGDMPEDQLSAESPGALERGTVNPEEHAEDPQKLGVLVVVTSSSFISDTKAEYAHTRKFCEDRDREFALFEVWVKDSKGDIALAEKVMEILGNKSTQYHVLYPDKMSLKDKISTIAREIYGTGDALLAPATARALERIKDMGFGNLSMCMVKTQYSLSDNQAKLGRPSGFTTSVRDAYVSTGAGFVVALIGSIMTIPGLPKRPTADSTDVDGNGKITGLLQGTGPIRRIQERSAGSGYTQA